MLKKIIFRSSLCLMALTLGACSMLQQPAAPTETGNGNPANESTDNTPPYTPPTNTTPAYTPPPPTGNATGGYVPNYSPVDINATTHTVQRGDTVYNIAKRYQITQDNVLSWNNLSDSKIKIGQVLRVKPAGYVAPAGGVTATTLPAPTTQSPTTPPNIVTTKPISTTPITQPNNSAPTATTSPSGIRTVGGIAWQRPTIGKVLQGFGGTNKGVDYGGTLGQSVVAAADGKVVYAGSGLRGYGNLIIIQHNQTYLTAYGHNQTLMVKEGQMVKRGQQIATMGNSDAKRTQLHFELRENGTPMDPSKYLPL